ncbi:DUF4194 domain-containing protein [Cryobacterium sp. Hh7]|uniref:DUF4194 domain-containing protein n=1 Tax=Cryobacterium sp. Hh7 TaxID=1259159 RepID=UPI00106BEEE5|nr:DUF4194 domain-containing protein [Cryobacterium sp. Hh7]TFD55054.1 DUF4194 domain-containing protein [Cryobacterium sp. Hh7]
MNDTAVDYEAMDDNHPGMLFAGDTGEFSVHLRTAIVRLVRGPMLSGEENELAYDALLRNEDTVRQHLSEMFLSLVINRDARIAFARQAGVDQPFPVLMRRAPLTLVESAVIACLRRTLATVTGTSEFAVVSLDEIRDEILAFRRFSDTNEAGIRNSVDSAVTKMAKFGILKKVRDTEDRYTIMPLLRNLFTLEEIAALLAALRTVADGGAATDAEANEDKSDD